MSERIAYVVSMGKGLESFIYREVDALKSKGQDIALFATKYKENDIYSPKKDWEHYRISPLVFLLSLPRVIVSFIRHWRLFLHASKFGGVVDFVVAVYFSSIMKRTGVTQIHCHFGDRKLFVGYYCKKILGLPLSVTIHSHELHANPNEKLFHEVLPSCDGIFAISQLAVDILVDRYGASADKVKLLRLFLDMGQWSESKPFRVITVARFEPQKGLNYLFEALDILKDLPIEFVLVGFGPLNVRQLAVDMGIQDRVTIFDKLDQSQLRVLYQSADAYCLPSITHPDQGMEGIPVVLMEAMACGLPVVATRAGGVPEIVDQILVDEKSGEQLAVAIKMLFERPDLRFELSQRNRRFVNENYSEINVIKLHNELNSVGRV